MELMKVPVPERPGRAKLLVTDGAGIMRFAFCRHPNGVVLLMVSKVSARAQIAVAKPKRIGKIEFFMAVSIIGFCRQVLNLVRFFLQTWITGITKQA